MDTIEPLLIIVTGPVGAGKSSTAIGVAQALRQRGRPTAVIDLDEVYRFVSQQGGYADRNGWKRARIGAAALVNAFFSSEMDVVIVEGEFFNTAELETLVARVDVGVRTLFYTLSASYEQCLARAQGDPARGLSKDASILRSLHQMFEYALPFLEHASVVIDTNALTRDQVATQLVIAAGRQAT
jgi:shikimate kinase